MIPPSAERFNQAALARGITPDILVFEQPTRTAQQAADAIGCDVAQIVKSLCFSVNAQPVMVLVSGVNQLDTKKLAGLMGVGKKKVKRADADTVKQATGFSIGGVPPFGHVTPMKILVDEHLTTFEQIWAAAGHPNAVFPIRPQTLVTVTGGTVADVRK